MGNFICFDFRLVFPSSTNTCSPHFSVLPNSFDGLAPIQKSESYASLSSVFPPDAYTAGHVLIIIDHLIGMERKLMNGGDIYPLYLVSHVQ